MKNAVISNLLSCFLGIVTLLLLATSSSAQAPSPDLQGTFALDPSFDASDQSAPEVTADNLLENERFWPYLVALTESLTPEPGRQISAGLNGVLIRVEPDGRQLRIDFGRDGLVTVPIGKTNIVAQANAVRTGALDKDAANYVFMFAPRLVDGAADTLVPYKFPHYDGIRNFLFVFADTDSLGFGDLAADLRSYADQPKLLTILFPQTRQHDRQTRQILEDYQWRVPFVYGHLSEYYTPSLLPDGFKAPAVLLVSIEGRLLFAEQWAEGSRERLQAAMKELDGQP